MDKAEIGQLVLVADVVIQRPGSRLTSPPTSSMVVLEKPWRLKRRVAAAMIWLIIASRFCCTAAL
jgi:hypothetical protein